MFGSGSATYAVAVANARVGIRWSYEPNRGVPSGSAKEEPNAFEAGGEFPSTLQHTKRGK